MRCVQRLRTARRFFSPGRGGPPGPNTSAASCITPNKTRPSRIEIATGLNLGAAKPTGRLEPSGNFSAMVSHRVRIESKQEVDAELVGWLRTAYDSA